MSTLPETLSRCAGRGRREAAGEGVAAPHG